MAGHRENDDSDESDEQVRLAMELSKSDLAPNSLPNETYEELVFSYSGAEQVHPEFFKVENQKHQRYDLVLHGSLQDEEEVEEEAKSEGRSVYEKLDQQPQPQKKKGFSLGSLK